MYCRNCGKETEDKICRHCGFESDSGGKFCGHCGAELLPGQKLCVKCGFLVEEVAVPAAREEPEPPTGKGQSYRTYTKNFKKICVLTLLIQIASLLSVAALLFFPIYTCEYEPETLDEWLEYVGDAESEEELERLLSEGTVKKNFSAFEDFARFTKWFRGRLDENAEFYDLIFDLLASMFLIFEMIFGVILLAIVIAQTVEAAKNMYNIDEYAMLQYNEFQKSGSATKKRGDFFKKQSILAGVMYALFDIVYVKIYAMLLSDGNTRYMQTLKGLSPFVIFILVFIGVFIVASTLRRSEEKRVLVAIAKETIDKE